MNKLFDAYMANKKITIPVTILVAVLLVGGIAWGVYATTSTKDEPAVTASKEVDTKADKTDAKKVADKKAENETSDNKASADEKNDTKASATGEVTDNKKDTSKKESASNKNDSSNASNNNQQTPAEPETPTETYDEYGRPMSCASTFFTAYNGSPAWKQSTRPEGARHFMEYGPYVVYWHNGVLTARSESSYNARVRMYNDGIRDCPSCGEELTFGYVSTISPTYDIHPGEDMYACAAVGCEYGEYRPHVCRGTCLTDGCILIEMAEYNNATPN